MWLPENLESLKCDLVSLDYPTLANLKRLQVRVRAPGSDGDFRSEVVQVLPDGSGPLQLHVKFPNLEWLDWESRTFTMFENVEALPCLNFLRVSLAHDGMEGFEVVRAASLGRVSNTCRVEYQLDTWHIWEEVLAPTGMAEQARVVTVTLDLGGDSDNFLKIKLALFAHWVHLESLVFVGINELQIDPPTFKISGLNHLPATCKNVKIENCGQGRSVGWRVQRVGWSQRRR